jgi:GNAT superfamily N-acetyltransferase
LDPLLDDLFLRFLMRDTISHFFALLDLKLHREKTKFWVARDGDDDIRGYLLEHDERIVYIRGEPRCVTGLLGTTDLVRAEFNVEPAHIQMVRRFYEPIMPVGTSRDRISEVSAMEVDRKHFRPNITTIPKKLGGGESDALGGLYWKFYEEMTLGPLTREQVMMVMDRCVKFGATYGIYEGSRLVSFASGSVVLEGMAHVAPVYTLPEFRRRRYATSACSALLQEFLGYNEKSILFVSENNIPALRVYGKLGFMRTGHKFLTFLAERVAESTLG